MTHEHPWRAEGRVALRRRKYIWNLPEVERLVQIQHTVISGKKRFQSDVETAWQGGVKHPEDTPIMDIAGWGDPD